jgi:ribosomal protein L6P/L9E
MCPVPVHWSTHYQNRFNTSLEIVARQISHYTVTYFSKFNSVFFALHRPFFHKLKFKGKGYYMYRNKRNTITPQLGHAHRILTYTFYVAVRFFKRGTVRRSIVLTGRLKEHLHTAA